jgi:hypothetical protein
MTLNGSSSEEALITADDTVATNYSVTMNVKPLAGGEASVVIRFVDSSNFYWMGIGNWGHLYSISKVVSGVYQELTYDGLSSSVQAQPYTLKAVVNGATLEFWVDNVKVLEVTDASIASGGFGIRTFGSSIDVSDIYASDVPLPYTLTVNSTPIQGITITVLEVN